MYFSCSNHSECSVSRDSYRESRYSSRVDLIHAVVVRSTENFTVRGEFSRSLGEIGWIVCSTRTRPVESREQGTAFQ